MLVTGGVRQRISKIASAAYNATRLLGPKVAVEGIIFHSTKQMEDKYYTDFRNDLWNKVMLKIPFNTQSLESLPAENNGPIWVAWWQGINDQTPLLILACIDSIRRHANGREVIVVTRDNYTQYVDIDPILVKRREDGTLTINAFCNALRIKLLYEHGGIWLDSTIYLTKDLSDDFAKYPFYSIHSQSPECHWTTYCLASVPGNPLMDYIYRCFVTVFKQIAAVPEYYLFDAFFWNAYHHIPQVHEMIDQIPVSNDDRFKLSALLLNNPTGNPEFNPNTYIFKLTHKMNYAKEVNGQPTVYQQVLDGSL